MEIKGKTYCFFEQSGTFKNEFIKLGIPAEDYDIQNNFGETDHTDDLFQAIEDAYDGKPSLWDNITTEDLIIAFFPCIYFCENNQLAMTYHHANYRKLTTKETTEKIMERARNRQHFYELAIKMFANAKMRGIRLIMENPWSGETFLKHFFVTQPSLIDKNRMMRGDYFTKPTAYWFVNCEPTWGGGIIPKRQREKTHRKPASWQRSWNLRRRAEHDKPGLRPELHLRLHYRKDTNQHANINTIRIMEDILHLPLKGKWYQLIKSGAKPEEYRDTTPYWMKRICGCPATHCKDTKPKTCEGCPVLENARMIPKRFSAVHFSLGYPKADDFERNMFYRIIKVTIGYGNQAWGAKPNKKHIIIHLDKPLFE